MNCKSCTYYHEVQTQIVGQEIGECHCNPPAVLTIPQQDTQGAVTLGLHSQFPPVGPATWCGDYFERSYGTGDPGELESPLQGENTPDSAE